MSTKANADTEHRISWRRIYVQDYGWIPDGYRARHRGSYDEHVDTWAPVRWNGRGVHAEAAAPASPVPAGAWPSRWVTR